MIVSPTYQRDEVCGVGSQCHEELLVEVKKVFKVHSEEVVAFVGVTLQLLSTREHALTLEYPLLTCRRRCSYSIARG